MATFTERLNEAMAIRQVNQTELARRTGMNKANISLYVNGKYDPKSQGLYAIAKALNVNIAWLMGYDVDMNATDNDTLEVELEVCDLFQQCYGKETYEMVKLLLKLDDSDRAELRGEMKQMLKAEKYSAKKGLLNA